MNNHRIFAEDRLNKKMKAIKDEISKRQRQAEARIDKLRLVLKAMEKDVLEEVERMEKLLLELESIQQQTIHIQMDKMEKDFARQLERRDKEIAVTAQAIRQEFTTRKEEAGTVIDLRKAQTIAIFDAILFAMDNWSTDGQTAPDVVLACQSVLFPTVYERVMSGNKDYFVDTVPVPALEIVRRGRELVKHLRAISDVSLVDPAAWEEHANMIHQWWIGDALPLIYGARDPDWDHDEPFTLAKMTEWRDMPASRALEFPKVYDGMELVDRFRDEIRDTTGLPEFTRSTTTTRLDP